METTDRYSPPYTAHTFVGQMNTCTPLVAPHPVDNLGFRLKWKPDGENSIDFWLNLIPPQSSQLHVREIRTQTPYDSIPEAIKWALSVWAGGGKYRSWGDMYLPPDNWHALRHAAAMLRYHWKMQLWSVGGIKMLVQGGDGGFCGFEWIWRI
jgi:hypothetical protein